MSKGTSAPMETPDGVKPIQEPVSTTEETLGALNNIKAGFIEIFNRDISNTAEFKLIKSHIIFRNQQNARWIGIDTQHHADNHNLKVKIEIMEEEKEKAFEDFKTLLKTIVKMTHSEFGLFQKEMYETLQTLVLGDKDDEKKSLKNKNDKLSALLIFQGEEYIELEDKLDKIREVVEYGLTHRDWERFELLGKINQILGSDKDE